MATKRSIEVVEACRDEGPDEDRERDNTDLQIHRENLVKIYKEIMFLRERLIGMQERIFGDATAKIGYEKDNAKQPGITHEIAELSCSIMDALDEVHTRFRDLERFV